MSIFTTYRAPASLASIGAGLMGNPRINAQATLVTVDWITQAVMDGYVFNASNAVLETDEALAETARGTDNINPSLLVDVPTGTTIVPLEVVIDFGETPGTSVDMGFTIVVDDVVRYSSGGAAITPVNLRADKPRASVCSAYSGSTQIVAIANSDDNTLFAQFVEAEATPRTAVSGEPLVNWSARRYTPPVLVGPAALLVYVISAVTNDQELMWSIKWAEYTTTLVK